MGIKDKIKIIDRNILEDTRGNFLKIMDGNEQNVDTIFGEIYLTRAIPGSYRANHYHKIANEWFTVIEGQAEVILEDIYSKEKLHLTLDSKTPQTLYCPKDIAHVFINNKNSSQNFLLIAYSDIKYDPSDTILYNLVPNE